MNTDQFLLAEFQKTLLRNSKDAVLNLDEKFPHKFGFFVRPYEDVLKQIGTRIPPHKWSYHRIGLLKTGYADFICGMYKFRAEKNTMIIIPSRVINTSNWQPDATGYLVVFNLDFFLQNHFSPSYIDNKRTLQASVQPYIRLTQNQADNVEAIFKSIIKEKEGDDFHKNELIALKLVELLISAERLYSEIQDAADNSTQLNTVKQFAELVELHFLQERSVAFYASKLFIHPNYLNSLVKTHTGLTAKDSIQNRILLEAKYLLHATGLSIKEISNHIGFDDPNYFSVFFKRFESLSPITYRTSFL